MTHAPELAIDQTAIDHYVQGLGHADLKAYQEWYGLKPDGIVGPITSTIMAEPRCGVPDFAGVEEAQWPRNCMVVTVSYDFDSINSNLAADAWKMALDKWNEVCGITLDLLALGSARGQIWATDGPLPGSTLAWSFLANDSCNASLEQRYDTTIRYTIEFLAKIIFHEIGHACGLGHSNRRDDIMFPSIGPAPWSSYPSQNDIRRMIQRYGEAAPPPPPPPPDPDEGWEIVDGEVTIRFREFTNKFRLIESSGV